jgi:uncharacterized protein YndB with AHSA1/START domain
MLQTQAHEATTRYDAPADRVRRALTTLAGIRGWWSPIVTGTLAPGGEFHVGFDGLDETITLSVVETGDAATDWLVRGHSSAPDWTGSRIRFEWEPHGDGSQLAVRHAGVEPQRVAAGWDHFLARLGSLVVTGVVPTPGSEALRVALAYHAAWTGGRFDDALALLVDDLQTDVPINSYASRAEWAEALTAFGSIVDRADLVAALGDGTEAVLIYDMHTAPYGVLRIAEHFTVADGSVVHIRHVHDTVPFRGEVA